MSTLRTTRAHETATTACFPGINCVRLRCQAVHTRVCLASRHKCRFSKFWASVAQDPVLTPPNGQSTGSVYFMIVSLCRAIER